MPLIAFSVESNNLIPLKIKYRLPDIMPDYAQIFNYLYQNMSKTALKDTRISVLVDQNYVHAYVLYYFGIRFFDYSELTLAQVCKKCGLKVEQVIREMEDPTHLREADLPLMSYPIDLIIEYLKHSHFLFIKHKLPYIARLVESFKANHDDYRA